MTYYQRLIVILLMCAAIMALVIATQSEIVHQGGDLNRDGKVDVRDWSIALYYSKNP